MAGEYNVLLDHIRATWSPGAGTEGSRHRWELKVGERRSLGGESSPVLGPVGLSWKHLPQENSGMLPVDSRGKQDKMCYVKILLLN